MNTFSIFVIIKNCNNQIRKNQNIFIIYFISWKPQLAPDTHFLRRSKPQHSVVLIPSMKKKERRKEGKKPRDINR